MAVAMTQFTVQVPTSLVPRIATAFAASYGYQSVLDDGTDNPISPQAFVRQQVLSYIKSVVVAYEANMAAEAARERAAATAGTDITLS